MLEVGERVSLLSVVTIVVHEICTINGLSISNEDCVVQPKGIQIWIIHLVLFSTGTAQWRQANSEGDLNL